VLSHLLERAGLASVEPETQTQDLALPHVEWAQQVFVWRLVSLPGHWAPPWASNRSQTPHGTGWRPRNPSPGQKCELRDEDLVS
jgi:hypothetical protein